MPPNGGHAERSEASRMFSQISNPPTASEMLRCALHDGLIYMTFLFIIIQPFILSFLQPLAPSVLHSVSY
ncbi:hypothetical protein GCM10011375_35470 [Hymenobacter qilianensis]|uniref:Uncharacterized protein n=1 Tax=Hymenobacter qilianensis TaxID=1385715 RepID=A0ACB5PW42_9BACT|nr:hypothetical protein GCM10011375_35470 [Hymenobacter qilianensis]